MNEFHPRPFPDFTRLGNERLRQVAAATLAGVMAAHVLLETACDSLFLANVSVDRLPWVTIAIALIAVAAARGRTHEGHRPALIVLQVGAALGTASFAALVGDDRPWTYYALSLWSGIVTSLVVVRFWLVLGDLFTIVEGKRFFAGVAMGGALGALAGSGAAAVLAPIVGGRGLLAISAGAYLLSSLGPIFALSGGRATRSIAFGEESGPTDSLTTSIRSLAADAYASRIALLVMLAGITLTLGDFLFKSVLTAEIPSEGLAIWLSRIYLALNLLSVGMLAIGVTPALRRIGIDRSLSVLPILIALAAIGVLAGGALAAVILLKLSDGTLRYSLHKTASELLYLPMSSRLRGSIKGAVDIVGQTFAKALASILLLGLVLLPEPRIAVAVAALVSAVVWAVSSLLLRRAYLDVFRRTLLEGSITMEIEHPELDLESAGSLIRALSNPDARSVIAAMRILEERGRTALIPSLILYHPSAEVVAFALDLFAATGRDDLELFLDRLVDHEDALVRAAAVRASWVAKPDIERLEVFRSNACAVVRVSSVAGLLAHGAVPPSDYQASLDEALAYPTYEPRLAASTAARLRYHPVNREALLRMANDEDYEVAREAVRAIAGSGDAWFTPELVNLLDDRRTRDEVRRALIDRGAEALGVLARALVDGRTPSGVVRHIPRTLARFASPAAVQALVESLPAVESGMVRFKVLRGLETLLYEARARGALGAAPLEAALDAARIRAELERTLARSLDLLETELATALVQSEEPRFATLGGDLIVDLLRDKRELAVGRVFMLLGLLHPGENFRAIREGLVNSSAPGRASAQELIETLLPSQVAGQILRLVSDLRDELRSASIESTREARIGRYEAAIRALLTDDSRSVRAVAMYHAAEVGISVEPTVVLGPADDESLGAGLDLRERAVATLRGARPLRPRTRLAPHPAR